MMGRRGGGSPVPGLLEPQPIVDYWASLRCR